MKNTLGAPTRLPMATRMGSHYQSAGEEDKMSDRDDAATCADTTDVALRRAGWARRTCFHRGEHLSATATTVGSMVQGISTPMAPRQRRFSARRSSEPSICMVAPQARARPYRPSCWGSGRCPPPTQVGDGGGGAGAQRHERMAACDVLNISLDAAAADIGEEGKAVKM